jgi:hypothetical protein
MAWTISRATSIDGARPRRTKPVGIVGHHGPERAVAFLPRRSQTSIIGFR